MMREEALAGGLIGLLVGDALGVPYEFHSPLSLPPAAQIDLDPPQGFPRAHKSAPRGAYSDDGAQALCLLASLLDRDDIDLDDFGARLVRWYDDGYLAVDGVVFDVGVTTAAAIRAMKGGVPAHAAGLADERSNGNGSLMRSLPLALVLTGSDESLVEAAHMQSRVTHAHPRSQVCCSLYVLWARAILEGRDDPYGVAVERLRAILPEGGPHSEELEAHVRPDDRSPGKGSGYVVDTLRSARWALDQGGYEDVVKAAIKLGNDTDTTACVAGGLAGLRDGLSAIPKRWRDQLAGKKLYEPLLSGLLELGDRTVALG